MTIARRAMIATIATLALIFGFAGVAQAAPPDSCAAASVCGYDDGGYQTGQGYEFIPGVRGCENVALNDSWSSIYNNSGRTIYLYKNANCPSGADALRFYNGTGSTTLTYSNPGWNNVVSSVRIS